MSKSEREHWEQRYTTEGARSTEPASFLREIAERLRPRSRILDVGGGSGRNALWLARRGHTLTIADISPNALALASAAAASANVTIETVQADFDEDAIPSRPWDVIIDFHFFKPQLFAQFKEHLVPGGLLVFCQATVRNLERHERPPRPYLLQPGEGWELLEGWELIVAREGWSADDRHEFESLARVPSVDSAY